MCIRDSRYTAHLSEAAHSHEFLEIGIILSGRMMHKTERGNRLLTEGCVYFIPDGHSHALDPDPGLIVRNLYLLPKIFLSDASEESTPVMLQDFLLYFTDPGLRQTAEIRLPKDQLTAVRSLLEACDAPPCCDLLSDAFRYHCLMNVLLLLCDSFGRACPECLVRRDARIYRILRLIRENLSLPTGELLRTISAELFLNPQYINRLIKKELHTTLSALISVSYTHLRKIAVETKEMRKNIMGYKLPTGQWIFVLAEGRLVNLAAGDGHPAEIMDMSFAIQALSAKYLVEHGREMTEMLIDVPVEIDEDVAARKLRFMGKEIDTLTAEQEAYLNKSLV